MFDYRSAIKEWMTESGVTFDELGNRLGCSSNAVWVKINAKKEAQYDGIIKISNALGYKEYIRKTKEVPEPEISKLMTIAENQRISFRAVEAVLECLGYEIDFKKRW